LDRVDAREHARRSLEIAIKSFGNAPQACAGPYARASDVHEDASPRVITAHSRNRPPNEALELATELWKQRLRRCIL